jgi:SAM-dependent methyltransferase
MGSTNRVAFAKTHLETSTKGTFAMIRSSLRRCKRALLRQLGIEDLLAQGAVTAARTEIVLRRIEVETASVREQLVAARDEMITALSRFVGVRHESMARLVESETAALRALVQGVASPQEHLLRILYEVEGRVSSTTTDEAERVSSVVRSQVKEVRSALSEHVGVIRGWNLDRWKIGEFEGLIRYLRRKDYFRAIQDGELHVPRLVTQHPVAVSSNDTKFPRGCKTDNSIAPRFNHQLYRLFSDRPRLRVLDLGCAGGGFVRSLIDDGHFAVGLEGSDFPLLNQTGEWSTIPKHLFTCDITKQFHLCDDETGEPLRFDAITAWELMEHIPEDSLGCLLENLDRHLAPDGLLLFSIATFLDWDHQTGTIWHVTVKPREWWEDRFARHGFEVEDRHPFGKDDWLRGSGMCRGDWHEDDGMGFHVVLRRKESADGQRESSNGRVEAAWRTDEAA